MAEWSITFVVLYKQHFILWIIFSGMLGLIVGSFINVIIHRLPIMLEKSWQEEAKQILGLPLSIPDSPEKTYNLLWPMSHCINCHHTINWFDNIPLFSWFMLKGHCRYCHSSISFRYVIVELLTSLMTMVICWLIEPGFFLLGALIFTWFLIITAFIDLEKMLLPDCLTLSLLWLGLLFNLYGWFTSLDSAVMGAIIGYMLLWLMYWLFKLLCGKEGIGYGDFKLLAALGAWLGSQYLLNIILLASISGIIVTILLMLCRYKSVKQPNEPIAFGFYLSMAGWITMVCAKQDYYSIFAL